MANQQALAPQPRVPAPPKRADDWIALIVAGVGGLLALLSPVIGLVLLWISVAAAWVTPTSTRTRVILTTVVALLSIAIIAGWDFGASNDNNTPAVTDAPPPDPAP